MKLRVVTVLIGALLQIPAMGVSEMAPDAALLSVRSLQETPDSVAVQLATLGYPEFRFSERLRSDQFLFSRGNASGSAAIQSAPILDVVDALSRNVEGFVSPVFLGNEPSTRITIRPELYVRFREGEGADLEEMRSILAGYGRIVTEEWALWKFAFRVALDTHSAIEALEIADTLARREDTCGRGPVGVRSALGHQPRIRTTRTFSRTTNGALTT